MRQRTMPIPKDSASFFKARARNPRLFQFTNDGNLRVPAIRDQPETILQLPYYRPATEEELAEVEEERKKQIAAIEEEFDSTIEQLSDAITSFREIGIITEVIRLQRELARLDTIRTGLRSPLRWTRVIANPVVNTIRMDMPNESRHMGYDVYKYGTSPYTFEQQIREGREIMQEQVEEEQKEEEEETETKRFVFFYAPDDEETGFMSPEFPIEFVYNSVKYTSALQAYEVERILMLGRKDVKPLLLRTRSTRTIRTVARGIPGEIEDPQKLWTEIYASLMSQHAEFASRLVETNTDTLVYANPEDGRAGIGMSEEDPNSLIKEKWNGTNWLGLALEAVRSRLKEEGVKGDGREVVKGGAYVAYTEHGRTQEEENDVRAKMIMGQRRKGKGGF